MDDTEQEIRRLKNRICILENENRLLKEKLTEAGISYEDIAEISDNADMLYDPDQGARIRKFDITGKAANNFFMMFCRGRKDVYELRYTNPQTGKTGYYTQCFNRWDHCLVKDLTFHDWIPCLWQHLSLVQVWLNSMWGV